MQPQSFQEESCLTRAFRSHVNNLGNWGDGPADHHLLKEDQEQSPEERHSAELSRNRGRSSRQRRPSVNEGVVSWNPRGA